MCPNSGWKSILIESGFEQQTKLPASLQQARSAFLHQHQQQYKEIQSKAVVPIYNGQNALLVSATASGKTEAAAIPIVARLMEDKQKSVCLYIAPTRALLNNLLSRLENPLHQMGMEIAIRTGDRPLKTYTKLLPFILTTPESLDVLLCKNYSFLKNVKFAICDEIHQLLGTPRGAQLLFLLERLKLLQTGQSPFLQRVALSATLGNPREVGNWFTAEDKPAKIIITSAKRTIPSRFCWVDRRQTIRDIVSTCKTKKILIFVNSRRVCDDLFLELNGLLPYRTFIHYSTLNRQQREHVESQFKSSAYAICIATSTLELGIDIGSIETVILYEPPQSTINFLQRIGRGGRRSSESPVIMVLNSSLDLLKFLSMSSLATEGIVEDVSPGQFYSVVIQQIFSYIAGKNNHRLHEQEVIDLCRAFPWIEKSEIKMILTSLSEKRYLRSEPSWSSYQMGPNLESIFNDAGIYSNISGSSSGSQIFHDGRCIGTLPIQSNQIKLGAVILYAGRFWEIRSLAGNSITVKLTKPVGSPIRPSYGGRSGNQTSSIVAQRIKTILANKNSSLTGLDSSSTETVKELFSIVPSRLDPNDILYYVQTNKTGLQYTYYTFAGGVENLFLQIIFTMRGFECQLSKGAEAVALNAREVLDFSIIPDNKHEVTTIIQEHWHGFQALARFGPFYELLPPLLKRKEVLSQVMYGKTVDNIVNLHKSRLVKISARLF